MALGAVAAMSAQQSTNPTARTTFFEASAEEHDPFAPLQPIDNDRATSAPSYDDSPQLQNFYNPCNDTSIPPTELFHQTMEIAGDMGIPAFECITKIGEICITSTFETDICVGPNHMAISYKSINDEVRLDGVARITADGDEFYELMIKGVDSKECLGYVDQLSQKANEVYAEYPATKEMKLSYWGLNVHCLPQDWIDYYRDPENVPRPDTSTELLPQLPLEQL